VTWLEERALEEGSRLSLAQGFREDVFCKSRGYLSRCGVPIKGDVEHTACGGTDAREYQTVKQSNDEPNYKARHSTQRCTSDDGDDAQQSQQEK